MHKTTGVLISAVMCLMVVGLVMLYSTSSVKTDHADIYFYLKRQVLWMLVSCVVAIICRFVDYHVWRRLAIPVVLVCVFLLILTLIPSIGVNIKGSRRWLRIGMNFQPSELAKIGMIFIMSWWLAKNGRNMGQLSRGVFIPLAGLGIILGLIFAEPDFGTTMLVGSVGVCMMFVAGSSIPVLGGLSLAAMGMFVLAVRHNPERMSRVTAFLDPEKYAENEAFQLMNAKYAFVSAGASGVGLGESMQKRFYLPEAHTDFIYAIVAEELGMAASMGILILFAVIMFCGIRIALRARDAFGKSLALGITLMISLQAIINIGVVTGCLPTKGLALPFISYGGSHLLVGLAMVGILVNIATQISDDPPENEVIKDRIHEL